DLRVAGPDSILQGVQLSIGPFLRIAPAVCESLAAPRRRLGARAASADSLPAVPSGTVRDVLVRMDGLGHHGRTRLHRRAGAGSREVAGGTRVRRRSALRDISDQKRTAH